MKTTVLIPTYNETGNIAELINKILVLYPDYDVLVVDDNSPDGTAELIRTNFINQRQNNRVKLIVRTQNRGRGLAGIEGYKQALLSGADVVVEMDGDMSHAPEFIKPMIEEILSGYDVVVGSRFIKSGRDEERGFLRQKVSGFARFYIRALLGIKLKDPTSGFRVFKRHVLERIIDKLKATDPFIVTEVYYHSTRLGIKFKEVPITFYERSKGESKLNSGILMKYLVKVLKIKLGIF